MQIRSTLSRIVPQLLVGASLVLASMPAPALDVDGDTPAAPALDLEGEWYVLVHFEERAPAPDSPDAEPPPLGVAASPSPGVDESPSPGVDYRDAVWRFEHRGDELRWTVFPDVAFDDETGRYEDLRGEHAHLRHAWHPSEAQLAEIRGGLALDERTARSKTLRRRGRAGFASGGSARAGSASAVAFGEHWEVTHLDVKPVFTLSATLASGRTDTLEGVTRFTAESVDEEVGHIEGRYARDGTQTGRFAMWRKGAVQPGDATFAAGPDDASLFGPGGAGRSSVAALQALLARLDEQGGRDDAALRMSVRTGIEQLVEESFTRRGESLRAHRAEIDALVSEIERLCVVDGVGLEEIDRRFEAGELRP